MITWCNLPKINDCKKCQGTGVIQSFPIDGMTIYSWQKSDKKPCEWCEGKEK